MPEIRIALRTTDRVAELARLIRPITGAPIHEIASAACGNGALFVGEMLDRAVEARIEQLLDTLSEHQFAFWIALDEAPTSPEVIRNMLRTSRESLAEQQLLGHLESPDSTAFDRAGLRAELLLGVGWRAKIILLVVTIAAIVLLITTLAFQRGGYCNSGQPTWPAAFLSRKLCHHGVARTRLNPGPLAHKLTAVSGEDILGASPAQECAMEDDPTKAAAETTEVFQNLAEASKLYAPYRELAAVAKLAAEHRPPVPAQPSWDHPLGLVIRSSK